MQLFVKRLTGAVQTVTVNQFDAICTLQGQIADFISSSEPPRLTHAGHDLQNNLNFADYSIHDGCYLSVVPRLRGGFGPQQAPAFVPMLEEVPEEIKPDTRTQAEDTVATLLPRTIRVTVRLQDRTIPVELDPEERVGWLKQHIQLLLGVPANEQRLFYAGHHLDDQQKLSAYNLRDESIIQLAPRFEDASSTRRQLATPTYNPDQEAQIFVKTLNGRTITLMVALGDTVQSLQEKVETRTKIPPSQQRLIYAGKQLQSEKLLGDYDLGEGATLHLVLRLRGGTGLIV